MSLSKYVDESAAASVMTIVVPSRRYTAANNIMRYAIDLLLNWNTEDKLKYVLRSLLTA